MSPFVLSQERLDLVSSLGHDSFLLGEVVVDVTKWTFSSTHLANEARDSFVIYRMTEPHDEASFSRVANDDVVELNVGFNDERTFEIGCAASRAG
jgi:hypothetical protein